MRRIVLTLWMSGLLLAGCATVPPTSAVASASAAIGSANEAGASSSPAAAGALLRARQEFEQARGFIDAGDNRSATGLLVRARADADLATSLARQARLRDEANALARRAEALRAQSQF